MNAITKKASGFGQLFSILGAVAVVMLAASALSQIFYLTVNLQTLCNQLYCEPIEVLCRILGKFLLLMTAVLFIPLCSFKRKSIIYSIVLSLVVFALYFARYGLSIRHLLVGMASKWDIFYGLNYILLILLLIWSFIKQTPKTSVGEHFKAAFSFRTLREESVLRNSGYAVILLSCLWISKSAEETLTDTASLVAVLLSIPFFLASLKLLKSANPEKKAVIIFICTACILQLAFFASQYCHLRILSYLSFILLLCSAIIYLWTAWRKMEHSYSHYLIRLPLSVLSVAVSFILIPNLAMGINVFTLKDNARCWGVNTAKPFVTIENSEGLKGLHEKNRIAIPPRFEKIFLYDTCFIPVDEYFPETGPGMHNLSTAVFSVLNPETGKYEKWDLLEHLEFENSYTDRFKRWQSNYPYSVRAARYRLKNALLSGKDESTINSLFYRLFKSELLLQYSKGFDNKFFYDIYQTEYASQPDGIRKLSSLLNIERFFPALVHNNIDDIEYECISNALSSVMAFGVRPPDDFLIKLRECLYSYLKKSDGKDFRIWTDLAQVDILMGHFNEAAFDARKAIDLSGDGRSYAYLMEADLLSGKKEISDEDRCRWASTTVNVKNHVPAIYEDLECPEVPAFTGALVLEDMVKYVGYGLASEEILPELEKSFGGYRLNHSYHHVKNFGNNVLMCSQNDEYARKGIYYGVIIRSGTYSSRKYTKLVVPAKGDIAVYFLNGKRGYIDLNTGSEITDCIFDHAWLFSDGVAVVECEGKLGIIDQDGKYLLQPTITCYYPKHFYEDLLFRHGCLKYYDAATGKCGLIGKDGKWIVSPKYDDILLPENGYRITKNQNQDEDRYGLIDSHNKEILSTEYHSIELDDYCIRVQKNENDDPTILEYEN